MQNCTFSRVAGLGGLMSLAACSPLADTATPVSETAVLSQAEMVGNGEDKFDGILSGTNGRTCGDCHVKDDHRALSPAHVQQLLVEDPTNPLFADVDLDDPNSGVRSFNNLSHGLARVVIPLHPRVDVIDLAGNVITNAARTIDVWRGVPSIDNVAYSGVDPTTGKGGYLVDNRALSLEAQAVGAFEGHSLSTHTVGNGILKQIAAFEQTEFSSDRAAFVGAQFLAGVAPASIPNPEDDPAFLATLTPAQLRGKEVYDLACTTCHGGATDDKIQSQAVLQSLCFKPKSDGNLDLSFTDLNGNGVFDPQEFFTLLAAAPDEPCEPFMNLGTGFTSSLGQMGLAGTIAFNQTATLPQYRFRFYADDARTQQVADLPPLPVINPDGTPGVDSRGVPIIGPAGAPQLFSTDPGRAAITGLPQDFEAFDVPQLRGVANTAPYFHDNLSETLVDAVDLYSRAILPFIPALGLPPIHPSPVPTIFGGESLTDQQKADLLEFLNIF